jgi:hypothetical protein
MPRDVNGYEITTRSAFAHVPQHTVFQGKPYWTVPFGTHAFLDTLITSQLWLQGGRFWVKGAALGDYAEFAVVDKDNVLGLFATYGLTVGVDVLELAKYVRTLPLSDEPYQKEVLVVDAAAPLMSGLYARAIYHSVGTVDPKMGITYLWYEE